MGLQLTSGIVGFIGFTFPTQHPKLVIFDPTHHNKLGYILPQHQNLVIKMATGTKFSPRTKHIALKYHHFRYHVKSGRVDIHYIPTGEQLEDLFTKPLSNEVIFNLRYTLCVWGYS